MKKLIELDRKLLFLINDWRSGTMDNLMWLVSGRAGKGSFVLAVAALIIYIFRKKQLILLILSAVLLLIVTETLTRIVKFVAGRNRPCNDGVSSKRIRVINNYRLKDNSFYSSHAANLFALSALLAGRTGSGLCRKLLYGGAGLVAYSRVYLGQHFPSDVIAGAGIGLLLGKLWRRMIVRR